MPSNAQKGSYYKQRTKAWLEARGWTVAFLERVLWIPSRDPEKPEARVPIKRDQFGADLLAMKREALAFCQVKLGRDNVLRAVQEFGKFPFPPFVQRWVVVWTKGASNPEVINAAVTRGPRGDQVVMHGIVVGEPLRQPALRLPKAKTPELGF
jgi:hypothetical protein